MEMHLVNDLSMCHVFMRSARQARTPCVALPVLRAQPLLAPAARASSCGSSSGPTGPHPLPVVPSLGRTVVVLLPPDSNGTWRSHVAHVSTAEGRSQGKMVILGHV